MGRRRLGRANVDRAHLDREIYDLARQVDLEGRIDRRDVRVPPDDGRVVGAIARVELDEGPRRDTSMQALGSLKPAFHVSGTVTAGNSSQMSDGAAAVPPCPRARACGGPCLRARPS